ncbi:MAG: phosphoserine phosphatase RsbU/P [Actinomycetota bacterium]|jgi:sigma-B regulation protein RsbU (phosphoserine phosphatase)|nr:phosphoserine phosphatase RsbU/P [Actinomycetota bacterium]
MGNTLTLPPEARASQRARAFLARELAGQLAGDALATAQLLVSELVTNSVVHAASAVEVQWDRDDAHITVRVRDADTGPLVPTDPSGSNLQEGGRGLLLVDQLADAWGSEHHGGRKTVWFRLPTEAGGDLRADGVPLAVPATLSDEPTLRTAERRLSTLLLPLTMQQALTFEQQLGELLARVVQAVGAAGGQVRWAGSDRSLVSCGQTFDLPAHGVELVLASRPLGTLSVYGDGLDEEDRTFLQVAAQRLSLLAYEHGVVRAGDEREAELDYLSEATELMTTTISVGAGLTLLTQLVVPRLGDWAASYSVDDRGRAHRVAANHSREERADALAELLEADRELLAAVQRAAAGAPAQRLSATVTVSGQRSSVAVVPLVLRGRTLGVLVVGRPQPLDARGFASLLELSRRAGLAVDNARLHEEHTNAATALQAALLPPALPVVEGLQLAARYHSAAPGMLVGGDFYDAFELPDGSVVCAIGDVCGKGAEAASVTGMTRDLIRMLMRDGHELPAALQRLNRALIDDARSSRFCTVALARLSYVDAGLQASICLAGHPEPVLLRADGTTEVVGIPGDLLGVISDDLELTEFSVTLQPGDALVFFTDGITERRDGTRMFGQYGVQQTLRRVAGADAAILAQEVETAARSFVDTELRDDLALLVARHLPQAASHSATVTGKAG